jgi:hypothetical protein
VFRDAVEACPTVIVGARGRWHLGRDWPWFTERYEPVTTTDGAAPDVWRRIDR